MKCYCNPDEWTYEKLIEAVRSGWYSKCWEGDERQPWNDGLGFTASDEGLSNAMKKFHEKVTMQGAKLYSKTLKLCDHEFRMYHDDEWISIAEDFGDLVFYTHDGWYTDFVRVDPKKCRDCPMKHKHFHGIDDYYEYLANEVDQAEFLKVMFGPRPLEAEE